MERLNTNGDIFPQGSYRFRITAVPEKGQTPGGYIYYQFQFAAIVGGEQRPYSERFMVWLMAPICRALGFEEVAAGEFEFDAAWCLGKEIYASVVHEKIAKGPSAGQLVARMKDIQAVDAERPSAPGIKATTAAQAPDDEIPF